MKKKMILMGVAGILVLTAVAGGTLAGFRTQSEQGKTDITTKSLGIELTGKSVDLDEQTLTADNYMPGAEVEMPYFVTNNVKEGYELYTRVTIYKYWQDRPELDAGKIHLYVKDASGNATELTSEEGQLLQVNNWFVQYADAEQMVLYYTKPMKAGEITDNVMDSLMVDVSVNNNYAGQKVILEIKADAVQKIAADASIPSEWGVYPTFDGDGNITAITE